MKRNLNRDIVMTRPFSSLKMTTIHSNTNVQSEKMEANTHGEKIQYLRWRKSGIYNSNNL